MKRNILITWLQLTRGFSDLVCLMTQTFNCWVNEARHRSSECKGNRVFFRLLVINLCSVDPTWLANVWRWCDVMAHIREHPRSSGSPGAALSPRCVSVLNSFFKPWISMEIGYGHTENKPTHVGMKLTFRKHGWFLWSFRNLFCVSEYESIHSRKCCACLGSEVFSCTKFTFLSAISWPVFSWRWLCVTV